MRYILETKILGNLNAKISQPKSKVQITPGNAARAGWKFFKKISSKILKFKRLK